MKRPRFSLSKNDFSAMSLVAPCDRAADHLLVDGDDAALRGLELHGPDDAAVRFAQRACAEALLPGGVPGDGDERAAGDVQVDAVRREVLPRGAEDRAVRLHEDA